MSKFCTFKGLYITVDEDAVSAMEQREACLPPPEEVETRQRRQRNGIRSSTKDIGEGTICDIYITILLVKGG